MYPDREWFEYFGQNGFGIEWKLKTTVVSGIEWKFKIE